MSEKLLRWNYCENALQELRFYKWIVHKNYCDGQTDLLCWTTCIFVRTTYVSPKIQKIKPSQSLKIFDMCLYFSPDKNNIKVHATNKEMCQNTSYRSKT